MNINSCNIIELPKITDPRGALSFVESGNQIPFNIQRVYYLYDIAGGASRAGHAHKELQQVLIAISGSFDVHLDDGNEKKLFHLNRPYFGLYIPSLIWREIDNFTSGAVCLSLVSAPFQESDYYRKYDDFIKAIDKR